MSIPESYSPLAESISDRIKSKRHHAAYIRAKFPNASRSFLAANSEDAGVSGEMPKDKEASGDALRPVVEQRPATGAPRKGRAKAKDSKRFLVRVTSVRRQLIDEDNLCVKYVVDCCRYAGLLHGDGPATTSIQAAQRKAEKGEGEHTVIEILRAVDSEKDL